ncbi:class I SAM-dependent methyltransferase [Mycobacterium adipatum]|uniref:class I SAM-dependent methyltransferase n=1 Tax=Mycobacterium adipatum TaxID=1682113 RepID=UPI0034E0D8AE
MPILINESNSVFSTQDFIDQRSVALGQSVSASRSERFRSLIASHLPSISRNINGLRNYQRLVDLLAGRSSDDKSKVLVIGSGPEAGDGMAPLASSHNVELVETDVAFGSTTQIVCDAHDLPFEDALFDAVIVQAVLEHVADPYRCVEEIHRVLKSDGLVYAETPFMQQVHMAAYDFTRFTHLGHRRLFRAFSEIDSGIACGPGMALAWSYQYFLLSCTNSRIIRGLLTAFAHLTSFFLLWVDRFTVTNPAAYDAASGFYFIGRKSDSILSDRQLIAQYRGAVWAGKE